MNPVSAFLGLAAVRSQGSISEQAERLTVMVDSAE